MAIRTAAVVEANVHEHIARAMYYFSIHLLYASLVGVAAWMLTTNRWGQRHHEVLDLGCDGAQFHRSNRRANG